MHTLKAGLRLFPSPHESGVVQVFKVKFVAPYSEQLQKLAADQTLREAMTGFAIGPGAGAGIALQHRAGNPILLCARAGFVLCTPA